MIKAFLLRLSIPISAMVFAFTSFKVKNVDERKVIATEMEYSLKKELLDCWYPKAIDTIYGGFVSSYSFDFKPTGSQDKMIVTQARHTWTNAKASQKYPAINYFKSGAAHGFAYLKNVMWDKTYGGFYTLTDQQGNVKERKESPKEAYGNAFGIYALATYYAASRDTAALNLAKLAFYWMETYSHDAINKGYFQHLQRDGSPVKRTTSVASTSDLGYKDQNSSIHILEALTELYQVWPDALVRRRLQEMLTLIRDRITTPKGYLQLFLKANWTPVSFKDSSEAVIMKHHQLDHVSFGHDVETGYLMIEASHVLGIKNDSRTEMIAKKMIDHALTNGWDEKHGGFYDEGYYFSNSQSIRIIRDTKNWWAQAEGLNSLLLMADKYPNDKMQYFDKFKQLWTYCKTYLIDHENGDWYQGGLDKEPERKKDLKGHIWKANYHQYRALANCIEALGSPDHTNQQIRKSR